MQLNLCKAGPSATDLRDNVLKLCVGKVFWITDTQELCHELVRVDALEHDSDGASLVVELLDRGNEFWVTKVDHIEELTAR